MIARLWRIWLRPARKAWRHRSFMNTHCVEPLRAGVRSVVDGWWWWREQHERTWRYVRLLRWHTRCIDALRFPVVCGRYHWPWFDPVVLEMYRKLQSVPPIPAPSVRSIDADAPPMWRKFKGGQPLEAV